MNSPRINPRISIAFLVGTTLVLTCLPSSGSAQEEPRKLEEIHAPGTATATATEDLSQPVMVLSLGECISLALERQPALAAHRATLASAEANYRALEDLRVPTFLVRDLPIRRKQASLGITVAAAEVDQAQYETVYAVTRTYMGVLYGRAQKAEVVDKTIDRLKATLEVAQRHVQGASKYVTTRDVNKITIYLHLAENRRAEAERGIQRALAALREAIGLEPGCCLQVPEEALPQPQFTLCLGDLVALALSRRGELVQAANSAQVTALEVCAQSKSCKPTMRTFASVVDIHARNIPQGISNTDYRPGAVGLEMPTTLVGSRSARMERARDLNGRADAVVEKARNLITLETEDAFYKWEESAKKVPTTKEAAGKALSLVDDIEKDFRGDVGVKVEDVLNDQVLWAQSQGQYNEALYQQVLALAALERITAGGFSAGLVGHPIAAPPAAELPVPRTEP
jgi:outer membrane protein TolC